MPRFSCVAIYPGYVNGGFQTVVRVLPGDRIPLPPVNLKLAYLYLNFTSF